MPKEFEEIVVDNTSDFNRSTEFYPFYLSRRSSRRKSSLQSLHHRRTCRLVRRLVRKSGKSSIHRNTANSQHIFRYLLDLSNTLIEGSWKWTLLVVSLTFILTWLVFAGLWMIISIDNVDVGEQESEPCLEGINSFAGYLLFSVETQSTIGYGNRYLNPQCPEGIFILCAQILVGVCICGSLICIVYLKMVGPRKLHSLNCFSKYAVICLRDGVLCLMFRVRDSANKYECLTKMSAYLVRKRQGELFLKSIKLDPVGILIWPVEVVHRINEDSPFWDLSAKDLIIKRFEVIVVLDGSSLATSNMSRATTSYLSKEIKWGCRFKACTIYDKNKQSYVVDHSMFNKTEEIDTPLCSSHMLREVCKELLKIPGLISCSATSKFSSSLSGDVIQRKEEDEENGSSSIVTTSAIVHANHEQDVKKNKICTNKSEADKDDDSSSSAEEEEVTFQDLNLEDLTESNVKSHSDVGLKAMDLLDSLQKFVLQDNIRRLRADRRNFYETSL